jgi:pyruvate dehydrogenase E2 component (dihydrolipoamide acetyltransferase)
MPSLGADMESGTVLEWYVKPGDAVKRGDIVALVDTSKAEIEVEIFEDCVIDELLVGPGTKVPVGSALARTHPVGAETVPAAVTVVPTQPSAPAQHEHRRRISPLARREAEALGVDLAQVSGSGLGGAVVRADVERAAGGLATPAAAPAPSATPTAAPAPSATPTAAPAPSATQAAAEPADRQAAMRQAIGALMSRSKREIPHYYLELQIDLSRALDWLHEENLRRPVTERLLPSALLLSAVARAVTETPELNGFWLNGGFQAADAVHLGVAVSLRGGGLIAPALHDADRKSLDEIMAEVRDLVQRARTGRLRGSEMSDPTLTVTNLGERGVDLVYGVIYPPQVALVGFGGIRDRPWAVDGMLGVRPIVTATLAADHRASDGHTGSRLLALIDKRLQKPEEL